MTASDGTNTLAVLLTELGPGARIVTGPSDSTFRAIAGVTMWAKSEAVSADPDAVVVAAGVDAPGVLMALLGSLGAGGTPSAGRVLLLNGPCPIPDEEADKAAKGHILVEVQDRTDPASLVMAVARVIEAPEANVTRRLSALQRSFTQALSDPDPVAALLRRVKSSCNATAAIVDRRGQPLSATGPLPLSLLFESISHTAALTQTIDSAGWHGVADRIGDPSQGQDHIGWLVVAARRPDFPDAYAAAAIHVATSLMEASQHITAVARRQERAVRSAVLEEALALKRIPKAPELAGRIAGLGLSFDNELRAVVAAPVGKQRGDKRAFTNRVVDRLSTILSDAGIASLASARESSIAILAQGSPAAMQRAIVSAGDQLPPLHVGVGRPILEVGGVPDSFQDAQLAIQTIRRTNRAPGMLSYEDLDFVTRLFSDVGEDRMAAWARTLLRPLADRPPLIEGLRAYLDHDQNIAAAAASLKIHHNSLRYRLAKVEEALNVSLRSPSALSSLFLAITASEFGVGKDDSGTESPRARLVPDIDAQSPGDVADPRPDNLGVVYSPER